MVVRWKVRQRQTTFISQPQLYWLGLLEVLLPKNLSEMIHIIAFQVSITAVSEMLHYSDAEAP